MQQLKINHILPNHPLLPQPGPSFLRIATAHEDQTAKHPPPSLQTSHSIKETNNAALPHHHSHHFERLLLSRPRPPSPVPSSAPDLRYPIASPLLLLLPRSLQPRSPAIRAADLPRRCFSGRCLALDLVSGSQK